MQAIPSHGVQRNNIPLTYRSAHGKSLQCRRTRSRLTKRWAAECTILAQPSWRRAFHTRVCWSTVRLL